MIEESRTPQGTWVVCVKRGTSLHILYNAFPEDKHDCPGMTWNKHTAHITCCYSISVKDAEYRLRVSILKQKCISIEKHNAIFHYGILLFLNFFLKKGQWSNLPCHQILNIHWTGCSAAGGTAPAGPKGLTASQHVEALIWSSSSQKAGSALQLQFIKKKKVKMYTTCCLQTEEGAEWM